MTTIPTTGSTAAPLSLTGGATLGTDDERRFQRLARLTGVLFILTYVTSIPPVLSLYVPALSDPAFVLGGDFDRGVSGGALLELLLILTNIGSALTLYPVLRRRFEVLSLGYVAARLTESGFIAVGILALLALNTLRLHAGDADEATLIVAGQSLVAVHDWTFRLGPGVVVGVGNGLMLGWMMWHTRLVPRAMSILGLIGGPALLVAGVAMIFGTIEIGSTLQVIATIPEFFWELSFGIWLLVKGFDPTALAALTDRRP
jgi:hypothetical protein